MNPPDSLQTARRIGGFLLVGLVSTALYWRTAYPTITWWDSSQYSLAAGTMGVPGPPGSLLLALLGWPLANLRLGMPTAQVLNLFAGVLAALTAVLVYAVALRMLRCAGHESRGPSALGAALGALAFAFSTTQWEYAVAFTPYVLTTVFTGLILLTMMRWWEQAYRADSWRHIALLGLLFGLDFSVHRTNALLMPGVLGWILLRNAHTLRQSRTWLIGGASLTAGLLVQLLLIPIARTTQSPLVWNDPGDLARLWSYISLERLGGGFLLGLFPRRSNFVTEQSADFLRMLGDNFFHWNGTTQILGTIAGIAGLWGVAAIWRRDRQLGRAFTLVLLLQAAMTVLYFNIPADYFRSLDRHYLPVCVTFGVAIACGLGVAMHKADDRVRAGRRLRAAAYAVVAASVPCVALADGWRSRDASGRYFTSDYARNALESLPSNAIYFTAGDNDTFPAMYMQAVEGVRRDVQVVNLALMNAPEYVSGLVRLDPAFPVSMTREQHRAESIRAESTLGDIVLLDVARTNRWRRPITFAITARGMLRWLERYSRLDGMYWRVVPDGGRQPDAETLHANLSRNEYRGYADPSVVIDETTRTIGFAYYEAMDALLEAEEGRGRNDRCRATKAQFMAAVPPGRLGMADEYVEKFRSRCSG